MSLSFIGPGGAFERRWIAYALLRDNVQHYLEGGTPSAAFAAIHSMSTALGAGQRGVRVSGLKLRAEIELIRRRLEGIPISDLAIGLRTRAVITHSFPLPNPGGTELVSAMDWTVPFPTEHAETVGELFEDFLEELLKIIGDDGDDVVTIIDT